LPIELPAIVEADNIADQPRNVENCKGETCGHIWDNNIKVEIREILVL